VCSHCHHETDAGTKLFDLINIGKFTDHEFLCPESANTGVNFERDNKSGRIIFKETRFYKVVTNFEKEVEEMIEYVNKGFISEQNDN